MAQPTDKEPRFRTAEEHDVYVFGLICGAIGAMKGQCDDPDLMGVDAVEEAIANVEAWLENTLDFGEQYFENELRDKLAGTRISTDQLTNAWELGYKNGLKTVIGPLPGLWRRSKRK